MAIPRTSYWSISNRSWNLGYQGVSSCRSTTTRNTLNSGCTSTVISCWCHQLLCGVFQTAAYGENLQICTPNFKTEADVVTYPSWCPHHFLALYMPPPKKIITSKGSAPPHTSCHQLERPCRDLLSGSGDTSDDALTPAFVACLQSSSLEYSTG